MRAWYTVIIFILISSTQFLFAQPSEVEAGPQEKKYTPAFFQGGDSALIQFVEQNGVYPAEALKRELQGFVFVTYRVDTTGRIKKPMLYGRKAGILDEEALRIVAKLPRFETPTMVEGEAVEVDYVLRVKFFLDDKRISCSPPWIRPIKADVDEGLGFSIGVGEPIVDPIGSAGVKLPIYPGGEEQYVKDLVKNLSYPTEALDHRLSAEIRVIYSVDVLGNVTNVRFSRYHRKTWFDSVAIGAVKQLMDYTKPPIFNGETTQLDLTVPIYFEMDGIPIGTCSYSHGYTTYLHAQEQLRTQNWATAEQLYKQCIEASPRVYQYHYGVGVAQYYMNKLKDAEKSFEEALTNSCFTNADSYYYLGMIYLMGEKASTKILTAFDRAIKINKDHQYAWLGKGKTYYNLGDLSEAELCFNQALSIDPGNYEGHYFQGLISMVKGDYHKSERSFTNALKIDSNADAYYNRGLAFARAGKVAEACKDWTEAGAKGHDQAQTAQASLCNVEGSNNDD